VGVGCKVKISMSQIESLCIRCKAEGARPSWKIRIFNIGNRA
jgi:hypothetical protein